MTEKIKGQVRILFLTDNYPPEVNAPASRTYEHIREWVKDGARVTVITCAPNFPRGKVFDGYRNKLYTTELADGVKIVRVWSYITANEGFAKRILDYISFGVMSFIFGFFQKADIIVATSPQFFTAVSGRFLAFFRRKPWIMEVRDLWPESIKAVSAMNASGTVFKSLESLEMSLYRKAKKIIVVTDAFKEKIAERGILPEKIKVIKNGVVLDQYKETPKNAELLDQLALNGKFVVGYLGTHGMAHKLDFIIECAAKITDPDMHFLFIGNGAEKNGIIDRAKSLGVMNCTFIDTVPKAQIGNYISITDVALVPLKRADTFKTVIPSKIFENAAMAKPILLGVEGESQKIIETYHAGICFEPENEADFLEKLMKLKNDPLFYKECQSGCRILAKAFDRKGLAKQMLKEITECV